MFWEEELNNKFNDVIIELVMWLSFLESKCERE